MLMIETATVIFWVLVALALFQAVFAVAMIWSLRNWKRHLPADGECPKAAVVLCLRGSDPFLADCLESLLKQDYPDYHARIVVDHPDDPAWQVAQEVIERLGASHVTLEPLAEHRATCSLLNSSAVQAIAQLDSSYEVVAFLDADVITHRTWLRELVAPLNDQQIAAAAGCRWYMPGQSTWGSLVRYLWNAAAVAQMYWLHYTWGGSVAVKLELLREPEVLDEWSNAFGFDTTIYGVVRRRGFRVAFVPSVMMVNRETCTLAGFIPWMQRQLLASRLYHPAWRFVLGQGIVTSVALAVALTMLLIALAAGNWPAGAWTVGGLLCYQAVMLSILMLGEAAVRFIVRDRGEPTNWTGFSTAVKLPFALPLTQAIYGLALPSVLLMRLVLWRGIRYRINSPYDVRMLQYQPYQPVDQASETPTSL
jgi:cellulose synthase/poly-beta-1,6-N-acetylglucosamine synthase-like glycosyltransferase